MIAKTTEDSIEQLALSQLEALGFEVLRGPDIALDGPSPERDPAANYGDVVLVERLRGALQRINPHVPSPAIEEAVRKLIATESPALIENNRRFHRMLADGVDVFWMAPEGERHSKVWLVDMENPANNDWLAVNQFTVIENKHERRPDIVLFANGLPLAVIELKNPADENATLRHAFNQLQTYKEQIPSLFVYNALLVISDGMQARFGTLTAGWDRFMPWRTIDGTDLYREPGNERQTDGEVQPGLTTLLRGMFDPARFQDYFLNFITFETTEATPAASPRRQPVTTSTTRSTRRSALRWRPAASRPRPGFTMAGSWRRNKVIRSGSRMSAVNTTASSAIAGSGWSGTPRGLARACPCCSTPVR